MCFFLSHERVLIDSYCERLFQYWNSSVKCSQSRRPDIGLIHAGQDGFRPGPCSDPIKEANCSHDSSHDADCEISCPKSQVQPGRLLKTANKGLRWDGTGLARMQADAGHLNFGRMTKTNKYS